MNAPRIKIENSLVREMVVKGINATTLIAINDPKTQYIYIYIYIYREREREREREGGGGGIR